MTGRVIGVIGGSGLYQIDGLADVEWRRVDSPFGRPSDEFCFGTLDGQRVVFLPRHGRGHVLPPSAINFRANIDALKRCGVTDIVSLSAVGSLREDFAPGDFVLVEQFVDRTVGRERSFFGPGCVAHWQPQERHEIRATTDARLLLVLAPWPGAGHPNRRD